MQRLIIGTLITIAAIALVYAGKRTLKSHAPAPAASAPQLAAPAKLLSPVVAARIIKTPEGQSMNVAAAENQIRNLDEKIDRLKRDVEDMQTRLDDDHYVEQLNSKDISSSTRDLLFDRIEEITRTRREVIDLRFHKIELLAAVIEAEKT